MREVTGIARQEIEKPVFGMLKHGAEWNTLAREPRRRERDEQAADRGLAVGKIGHSGIHQLAAGEAQLVEARRSESRSEPSRCRRAAGHGRPGRRGHARGPRSAAGAAVGPESLADLRRQFHGTDHMVRG